MGFIFDQAKCVGCQACEANCKSVWGLPAGMRWRHVISTADTGTSAAVRPHLSMACNHCTDPACAPVCPVKAYSKTEEGVVVQDSKICIGCQNCYFSCPYKATQWSESEHKVHKCNACLQRPDGETGPACVAGCPTKALTWGDIAEFDAKYPEDAKVIPDPTPTHPSLRVIPATGHVGGAAPKETTISGDMLEYFKPRVRSS